jgi:hypothetical protein
VEEEIQCVEMHSTLQISQKLTYSKSMHSSVVPSSTSLHLGISSHALIINPKQKEGEKEINGSLICTKLNTVCSN